MPVRAPRILIAAPVLALLLSPSGAWAQLPSRTPIPFGPALAPGDPAPPLRARDLAGEPLRHEYADHAFTVVNFWASWCVPCREEMPALQGLLDRRKDDGLAVVGILLYDDSPPEEVRAFLRELGVRYTMGRAFAEISSRWGGIGIFPTTFLVDRQGKIVRRYVGGASETIAGMVRDVEDVLSGRPLRSMLLPPPPAPDAPPPPPEP